MANIKNMYREEKENRQKRNKLDHNSFPEREKQISYKKLKQKHLTKKGKVQKYVR